MAPPVPPEASKEIERIKALVARYFPVYDVRVSYDVVQFFCRVEDATLEERFEEMREDMAKQGYIPMIVYDKGEHIITVAKKPSTRYRSIYVNLVMLVITFIAMLIAGAYYWVGYADLPSSQLFGADALGSGLLYFTLPLIAILAVHELAHFAVARRRHVAASLPFFIPSIPPLGTFGAFISLRDPIPNKKSLLDIGLAGPIAGFLMTIPIAILGIYLTNLEAKPVPTEIPAGSVTVMLPIAYIFLGTLVPIGNFLVHPMAFAGWVGFLVTGLNLLPVGQLDGGHVARALFGARTRYLTWATIAVMVGLGFFYFGWLIFALFILFIGARHPPPLNDISKLDRKRIAAGLLGFVILVVSFVPIPLTATPLDHSFTMEPLEGTNTTIAAGQAHLFQVVVNNTGNTLSDIQFSMVSGPPNWFTQFKRSSQNDSNYSQTYTIALKATENATIDILIHSATTTTVPTAEVKVKGVSLNSTIERNITFGFNISAPAISYSVVNDNISIARGAYGNVTVQVTNSGPALNNVTFVAPSGSPDIHVVLFEIWHNVSGSLTVNISEGGHTVFDVNVYVLSFATPGPMQVPIEVDYAGTLIATFYIHISIV